jgi:hypothetical protein
MGRASALDVGCGVLRGGRPGEKIKSWLACCFELCGEVWSKGGF